jgi:predicted dehydrogenase/threonine dehydrogenase-like Zn-dependent dehydrogenase
MASIEQVLRAVYDRMPDDVQPALRRSYRWASIRAEAAHARATVNRCKRVTFEDFEVAHLEPREILGPRTHEILVEMCVTAVSPGTETSILCGWPGTPRRFPYAPGYSGAGVVGQVGASVSGFVPGDRVAGGLHHASRDTVSTQVLVKVPDGVTLQDASFTVLGVIALQGVRKAAIAPGERVAVVGQGLVGQLSRRLAALSSPSAIVAIGSSRARSALALSDGDTFMSLADAGLDSIDADVVIEAAGTPDSIATALRCAARGGRVVIVGSGRTLDRNANWVARLQERDLTILGAHLTTVAEREASPTRWSYQQEAALFLELLRRNRLRVDDLVTWRARPEACNEVYEQLASGRSKHLGIIFEWRPEPASPPPPVATARSSPEPRRVIPSPAKATVAPLRIGIVGLGSIGQQHAREAAKAALIDVVAVYDTNQKVSRQLAASLSASSSQSYDALLNQSNVDAVLLAVPNYLHRDLALQAAAHGKHVLLEKPLAITMREADEIVEGCKRHGVTLSVNFSFRYLPRVHLAKRLIDQGAVGEITGVQAAAYSYRERGYWHGARSASADDWRTSKEKAGAGFFFMNLCHVIDYIYFITGLRASRVYCEHGTLGSPTEVDDSVSISCRFDNGAIGTISGGCIRRGANQAEERIWGSQGTVTIDDEAIRVHSARAIDGSRPGKTHTIAISPKAGWIEEWLNDVTIAIREGRRPAITGREGWENLAFITTALRSMEEGRSLGVPRYPAALD